MVAVSRFLHCISIFLVRTEHLLQFVRIFFFDYFFFILLSISCVDLHTSPNALEHGNRPQFAWNQRIDKTTDTQIRGKKARVRGAHTTNRIKLNLIDIKLSFSYALWIDDVVCNDEREHAMHEYAM